MKWIWNQNPNKVNKGTTVIIEYQGTQYEMSLIQYIKRNIFLHENSSVKNKKRIEELKAELKAAYFKQYLTQIEELCK